MESVRDITEDAASTDPDVRLRRWPPCARSPSGWRSSRSTTPAGSGGPGRRSQSGSASPSRPCTARHGKRTGGNHDRAHSPRDATAIVVRPTSTPPAGHPYLGGEHFSARPGRRRPGRRGPARVRRHTRTPRGGDRPLARARPVRRPGPGRAGHGRGRCRRRARHDRGTFGRATLTRAARAVHRGPAAGRPRRRFDGRGYGACLPHRPGTGRPSSAPAVRPRPGTPTRAVPAPRTGHPRHQRRAGALGPVWLGTSGPALSTTILDRYRSAADPRHFAPSQVFDPWFRFEAPRYSRCQSRTRGPAHVRGPRRHGQSRRHGPCAPGVRHLGARRPYMPGMEAAAVPSTRSARARRPACASATR